jgi:hypothetical protein
MYIHVFLFRWTAGVTDDQKQKVQQEIRKLQGVVPGLLETYLGENASPRGGGYAFGGVMKFTNKAAYEAYVPHPAHQELLGWLLPLIEPLELDFAA